MVCSDLFAAWPEVDLPLSTFEKENWGHRSLDGPRPLIGVPQVAVHPHILNLLFGPIAPGGPAAATKEEVVLGLAGLLR